MRKCDPWAAEWVEQRDVAGNCGKPAQGDKQGQGKFVLDNSLKAI